MTDEQPKTCCNCRFNKIKEKPNGRPGVTFRSRLNTEAPCDTCMLDTPPSEWEAKEQNADS